MNNLDLFKLLGSLFDFYQKNSNKNSSSNQSYDGTPTTTNNNEGEKDQTTSPFGLGNIFGNLFNNGNANNQTETPQTKSPQPFVPLQSQMLSTMRSHDQIVKRVKEKASK